MTTSVSAAFPATRLRRLRRQSWTRRLVAENALSSSDLIWPVFIVEGQQKSEPVVSMPGVNRLSTDLAVAAAKEAADLGIPVIALFPCIDPSVCIGGSSPSRTSCDPERSPPLHR
jgi:porphobilinogen synthase